MVRLAFNDDGAVTDAETFGAAALTGQLNLASLQPNLTSYDPETTVRKFPWNRESKFRRASAIEWPGS